MLGESKKGDAPGISVGTFIVKLGNAPLCRVAAAACSRARKRRENGAAHLRGAAVNAQDFGFIRELMRRRSAIVLENGKEYLAEFRLGALAKREGLSSIVFVLTVMSREWDTRRACP